ncbi:MAG: hypothetical protein WC804_14385 [Sphingomonas sp.]|jgi:hypothetical protein|uniref:hypothetical protein n=1 Tax=Sphingomonas sp. TaxID=28214 RepID=UPI00356AF019
MIVAVPILIVVGLFLGWCLVRLFPHALPLFAGLTTMSPLRQIGASVGVSLAAGAAIALLFAATGKLLRARSRGATVRAAIMVLFTAPACFAAYHAAMGLTALAMTSDAWRTVWLP